MASRSENQLQTIFKDPVMKWLLRIAGIILIIVLSVVAFKAVTGRYVKFFGIEINAPKSKPDTVNKIVQVPPDTTQNKKENNIKQPVVVFRTIDKKTEPAKDTAPKIQAKNVNTGTNNGIIGDNATVNAPIQPHPDSYHVKEMNRLIPNKDTAIEFYYQGNSRMSQVFVEELISMLKKDGYKNMHEIVDMGNDLNAPKGINKMNNKNGKIRFFINVEN
jgi:hypothetical protein